jgi:hypothetical protein
VGIQNHVLESRKNSRPVALLSPACVKVGICIHICASESHRKGLSFKSYKLLHLTFRVWWYTFTELHDQPLSCSSLLPFCHTADPSAPMRPAGRTRGYEAAAANTSI